MKILYVITGLSLGGAEKVVTELADKMVLKGHEVKIAYLTGKVSVKPNSEQIEIIALGLNSIVDLLKASLRYRQLIKTYKPDIVHAHMVHANIFTRLNRIGCSIPRLLCTAHSSNEGGQARMIAYRVTNFLSNFNSNVSEQATQSLIQKGAFSPDNLHTVYNGVDLNKFNKLVLHQQQKDKVKILAVGRFSEAKDYPNLLHAIAILRDQTNTEFHLEIAGDGELRPILEALIQKLRLEQQVTLLGKRADIPDLLCQADIFVLASVFEGLPTVVLEAMACQCYVIATDCGGTSEIMGDTGQLVPIKNSQALADAMQRALSLSATERQQNNQKARLLIENTFSLEASVNTWLTYYESL
ncbi:glycosyltransferase [Acinetobacter pseudolwoffii]|uniref:glycosyltransferase n=1 Tax=Acinetobacter pseudolwoffii TaxID=2053287 RepID=UPI001CE1112D|nr:glycosyltransferase [Acinetobacter pseudolwoffii]UBX52503.1 glycosyltransferase [Acinetobacter pseudolwoffii]